MMDGRSVFFNELTRLLGEELSGAALECVRRDNDLHLTLTRVTLTGEESPSREVQVNFLGGAAFFHWNLPGGTEVTEGPFSYSYDGGLLTHSPDSKPFTPEEFTKHVLLVLRT